MALLVFQHERDEGIGEFGPIFREDGHQLRVVEFFNGDSVPADLDGVDGVVSLGGTMNADQTDKFPYLRDELDYLRRAHEAEVPVLGICLGAQLIAEALGGKAAAMPEPEVGWEMVKLAFPGTIDPIHQGLPWQTVQMHMHGQEVVELPPGATPLAGSARCRHQAFKVGLRTYAFQYHPEWNLDHLRTVASLYKMVQRVGQSPESLMDQASEHYPAFRHLADRLGHNIAQLLFPIDKR